MLCVSIIFSCLPFLLCIFLFIYVTESYLMLVGSTNEERFKSVDPLHPIFVVVHKCNLCLRKQEPQLLLGCADHRLSFISEGQRPNS